jgi:PKD repeat protein
MKNPHAFFVLFIILGLSFLGCETREDAKQPVACFGFEPVTSIEPGMDVTFTNCSTDAETYTWEFDDGEGSVAQNPTHSFDQAGDYDVKLIVTNKNLRDEISHKVVVESLDPVACFTMSPNPAMVNQNVTITNCSENAETYKWDFDGNGSIDSDDENPVFYYSNSGTYTVKLIASNGNLSDELEKQITILDENFVTDPTDYNGIPAWETIYYNDFSASGDWYEGSGETYEAYIANGFYTLIDTDDSEDNYGRYYFLNTAIIPNGNYDIEVRIRNTEDNGNYGSGLLHGLDSDLGYNYYVFTSGVYNIGDSDASWTDWASTTYGNVEDWNLLTVRKYENTFYFFMNQILIYSDDYSSFGDQIGFIIDKNTQVDIDAVGIFEMLLNSKKAGKSKVYVNTGTSGGVGLSAPVVKNLKSVKK